MIKLVWIILVVVAILVVLVVSTTTKSTTEPMTKTKPMIATKLVGGFGNVLFIITFISTLAAATNRKFTITNLDTHVLPHGISDVNKLDYIRQRVRACPEYVSSGVDNTINFVNVREEARDQWDEFVELCASTEKNIFFDGYFQRIGYVQRAGNRVHTLFGETPKIARTLDDVSSHIITDESMFIHVRHGDYNKNLQTSPEYYIESLQLPIFDWLLIKNIYVFAYGVSDINDYVNMWKEIVPTSCRIVIVDPSMLTCDLDQFYAMARMRYGGICSNSTFSWWAAWLNLSPDKQFAMPNPWLDVDNLENLIFGVPVQR
jgi:hypothetical protein